MSNTEYLDSLELEQLTGTKASTWRYWAHIGSGPPSFKLGRRRVWRRETVLAWLAEQEQQADRDHSVKPARPGRPPKTLDEAAGHITARQRHAG